MAPRRNRVPRRPWALLVMLACLAPWLVWAQATPDPNTTDAPDLAARFRVTWTVSGGQAQAQIWQLNRAGPEIGWIKGLMGGAIKGNGAEEVWRRDASGIRLERVLRDQRHLIRYSAGELRTLGVHVDWQELGSLVAQATLAQLRPLGPASHDSAGHSTSHNKHYRGMLAGDQVDLLWDPVARLPVRLVRSNPRGQVVYQRLALHAKPPPGWPRAGDGSDDFQPLDAADFGDMDYNPVVRQQQARDERAGWRAPHSH